MTMMTRRTALVPPSGIAPPMLAAVRRLGLWRSTIRVYRRDRSRCREGRRPPPASQGPSRTTTTTHHPPPLVTWRASVANLLLLLLPPPHTDLLFPLLRRLKVRPRRRRHRVSAHDSTSSPTSRESPSRPRASASAERKKARKRTKNPRHPSSVPAGRLEVPRATQPPSAGRSRRQL